MENEIMDVEAAPRFSSEVTHDLATRKEVNALYTLLSIATIVREATIVVILAVLFGYLYCYSGATAYYGRTIFVVAVLYWFSFFYKCFRHRSGGEGYRLMLRQNGGNPVHNKITFTEDSFCVVNTYTEAVSEYTYDRLRSIAQTKHFFLLYRELNQCTVVSKEALSGGDTTEFLTFIRTKSTCLRSKEIKKPTLALAIRWTGYAMWAASLGLAISTQF